MAAFGETYSYEDGLAITVSQPSEFQPSEFSKLVAGFERLSPERGEALSRILIQASFALGPHKPHPF